MSQTQLVHITSGRFSLITFGTYCLQVGASSIATAHTNKSSPLPLQILNSLDPHYELSKPLMADTGMWVSMPHHHKFLVLANAFRIDPTHCIGFGMPKKRDLKPLWLLPNCIHTVTPDEWEHVSPKLHQCKWRLYP
jgi:hypothetical protein